jgi:hypothetical protein
LHSETLQPGTSLNGRNKPACSLPYSQHTATGACLHAAESLCETDFLYFIHRLGVLKTFRKFVLLPSSGDGSRYGSS